MSVRVEICRPRQAAWVGTEGMGFDWAWRVTGPGGNVVTGLRKGSRAHAEKVAKGIARRLRLISEGSAKAYTFHVTTGHLHDD